MRYCDLILKLPEKLFFPFLTLVFSSNLKCIKLIRSNKNKQDPSINHLQGKKTIRQSINLYILHEDA